MSWPAQVRLWFIKKLIPHYTTQDGQDLAVALWHWVTPHVEHAGYEWTWQQSDQPKL